MAKAVEVFVLMFAMMAGILAPAFIVFVLLDLYERATR